MVYQNKMHNILGEEDLLKYYLKRETDTLTLYSYTVIRIISGAQIKLFSLISVTPILLPITYDRYNLYLNIEKSK